MDCFSKLWSFQLNDFWKGLVIAVLMAVLTVVYETLQKGTLNINWNTVLIAGIGAGVSYLLKNFATGKGGRMLSNKK